MSLFSHNVEESQHKLVARLGAQKRELGVRRLQGGLTSPWKRKLTAILWVTLTLRMERVSDTMPALSKAQRRDRKMGMEKKPPGGLWR